VNKLQSIYLTALAASSLLVATSALAEPQAVSAALSDPARPAAEAKRDADRHAAETLAFIGVKAGDKVMDFMPGGGYFTHLFLGLAGPSGKVYSEFPSELLKIPRYVAAVDAAKTYAASHPSNAVLVDPVNKPSPPEPLDVVFTAQNYHDLHDAFLGPADVAAFNTAIFKTLKPGGAYVIIDHSASAGSGLSATNTLHRIDEETVKAEVKAAGFVLESEGRFLSNPADGRDKNVFDPSVRGKTDQFILKFRKPRG
jgi:predicted methyltransferase